ncbi:HD-GYP domain-containing protein [Chitinimonas lacunae]|uniref:HD-GYP domain-containing protein n=1 Tax=Chitinimonas lacunae TaxID=1963018 RepID=A0ABV8MQB7_9NEIS
MIKHIPVSELKVGMYIHDLGIDWLAHPFMLKSFLLHSERDLQTIMQCGIRSVDIDTERGLDLTAAPPRVELDAVAHSQLISLASATSPLPAQVSLSEEIGRARALKQQASRVTRQIMQDARLGRVIQLEPLEQLVDELTASLLRHPGALISLLQVKRRDEYTFLHSLSVGVLLIAFGQSLGFDEATVRQLGLGGLLHDTGKALIPDEILNKPGPLSVEEFAIVQRHPNDGHALLQRSPDVGPIPLRITLHHHERCDGSGYPDRLSGEAIDTPTRMAAIVDVYDAMTSERHYHRPQAPTEVLRYLFEASPQHFDATLVKAFMRCVGIYPVGSLVLLDSQRLAVVVEHNHSNLICPKVRAIYDTRQMRYITPQDIDLARSVGHGGADSILRHENPEKWQIDPYRFL